MQLDTSNTKTVIVYSFRAEPASNYATVRHSETSPASLACLSPSTPSILGDSSGLVTSASSDSRLQTFSEANPSTPCSQFDQQEKEFCMFNLIAIRVDNYVVCIILGQNGLISMLAAGINLSGKMELFLSP